MNNPDLLSFAPHALNPMKLSVQAIIQKLGVLAHPREKVKRTKIILRKRFPALRLVELNHSTALRWEIHHPPLDLLGHRHPSDLADLLGHRHPSDLLALAALLALADPPPLLHQ